MEEKFKEYTLHSHAAPARNEWNVEAYFGNWRKAGEAEFVGVYERGEEGNELVALKGWNVEVGKAHQRKGLARAMYAFAERAFGLPIVPGDFQTPEGERFVKAIKNPLLKLGASRLEQQPTASLRKATLRSRNDGSLQSAITSAGYHAKKRKEPAFVYEGNSYMHSVWRVAFKPGDYLNAINNTGDRVYEVRPDLAVYRHEVVRKNPASEILRPDVTFSANGDTYADAPAAMAACVALAMRGEPAKMEALQHGLVIDRWTITAKRERVVGV